MEGIIQVFKDIMNDVLAPILKLVLETVWYSVKDFLQAIYNDLLYAAIKVLLNFVDTVEATIKLIMGTNPKTLSGEEADLLALLFNNTTINKALIGLTIISFMLTFLLVFRRLFTVISEDAADRTPFATLLKQFMRCWGRIGLTMFYCILLINATRTASAALMKISGTSKYQLSNVIFVLCAVSEKTASESTKELIEKYVDADDTVHRYGNEEQIRKDFDKSKVNFTYMVIMTLFALISLFKIAFKMMRRVFDIVLLALLGPLFAALSLIKGDERKYKQWQSYFVAMFMSSVFLILGMILFYIFSTKFIVQDLKLYTDSYMETLFNSFLRLFFVISMLTFIPDSLRFAYTLLTDQGRFIANDEFSLKEAIGSVVGLFTN